MKRKLKDLSGKRYGKLVAICRVAVDVSGQNNHTWLFQCDCGNKKETRIKNANSGKTSSCGCIARDILIKRNTSHGKSRTVEYKTWKEIWARCTNQNNSDYANYGARGIMVSPEWNSYEIFYRQD